MQSSARKDSPLANTVGDISQDNLSNKVPLISPHEQAKGSAIDSKTLPLKTKSPKSVKKYDLARLIAAYGDCV